MRTTESFAAVTFGDYVNNRYPLDTMRLFVKEKFHKDTSLRFGIEILMGNIPYKIQHTRTRWCIDLLLSKDKFNKESLEFLKSCGGILNPIEVLYYACRQADTELFEYGISLLPGNKDLGDWVYYPTDVRTKDDKTKTVWVTDLFSSFMQLAVDSGSVDMVKYLHGKFSCTTNGYHDISYLNMAIYQINIEMFKHFVYELNYIDSGKLAPSSYAIAKAVNPGAYEALMEINPNHSIQEGRDYLREYRMMRERNLGMIKYFI